MTERLENETSPPEHQYKFSVQCVWEQINWHNLIQWEPPLITELNEVGHCVGAVCLTGYVHHVLDLRSLTQSSHCPRICKEQIRHHLLLNKKCIPWFRTPLSKKRGHVLPLAASGDSTKFLTFPFFVKNNILRRNY